MFEAAKKLVGINQKYRRVFSTPDGKEVLYHMMKASGMMHTNYAKDPFDTAYKEGQRSVIVTILRRIGEDEHKLQQRIEMGEQNERDNATRF